MKFIAHRGNCCGPSPYQENTKSYIEKALEKGYDVEIDIQTICCGSVYLGHDMVCDCVDLQFLSNEHVWCHAKNVDVLKTMLDYNIHCFWHQNDSFTLTSKGWVWTFPSNIIISDTIMVLPELYNIPSKHLVRCAGICSDFIEKYFIEMN